jgi:hypothetical protein
MTLLFEKVYFVKPEASSNYGHEVYIVGENYYDNLSHEQYTQLYNIIELLTSPTLNIYANKTYIDPIFFNIDMIKSLEKLISNYYSDVLAIRNISLNIFKKEIASLINTPEKIIPKIKELNTLTWNPIKNTYEKYIKKLNLKKIDDDDKIISWI